MINSPTHAIVRKIPRSYVDYYSKKNIHIYIGLAEQQHDKYVQVLKDAKLKVSYVPADENKPAFDSHSKAIETLARVRPLTILGSGGETPEGEGAVVMALGGIEVVLPMAGMVDLDRERERLEREIETTERELSRLEAKLKNTEFLSKAPASVVERDRERLGGFGERLDKLREQLSRLD